MEKLPIDPGHEAVIARDGAWEVVAAWHIEQQGADITAVDICEQIDSVPYPMSTPADLEQTVKEVEAEGGRIVARQADVRDVSALRRTFDDCAAKLGPAADAGIGVGGPEANERYWDDVIAITSPGCGTL